MVSTLLPCVMILWVFEGYCNSPTFVTSTNDREHISTLLISLNKSDMLHSVAQEQVHDAPV